MTCLSKQKTLSEFEKSWKKIKSHSTLPLPWRDRSAACPFLTISISWWLKIHFALTVNSPLANSFSPTHSVGVHDSLEATRDRAWHVHTQMHSGKRKSNSSDPAASGFTWSREICGVAKTLSSNDLYEDPIDPASISDFTAASRQKVMGCIEF